MDSTDAVSAAADVVMTVREAQESAHPPLLIIETLEAYLDDQRIGRGPIAAHRIGDGHSNVTYLITRTGAQVVLRRGPRPPFPPSAHDMMRESRLQTMLGAAGLPVPRILSVCDDESVLGVPFYLMEYVDGHVITSSVPAEFRSPQQQRALSRSAVDVLVRLHSTDITSGDLAGIGRPVGYLARQVSRFSGLWSTNSQRVVPLFDRLGEWLEANRPDEAGASLVHGDYRIGNLMYDRDAPTVACVLDWEMATLGDPLADLGYFITTYSQAGSDDTPLDLTPVTRGEGFLTRDELIRIYAGETGLRTDALPWYEALALWKGAVFCEAIYTRWLRGERPGDTTFGPSLKRGVPGMLETARRIVGIDA